MTPAGARAVAAPDSWPWPMSQAAAGWVEFSVGAGMQASVPETPVQQGSHVGAAAGTEFGGQGSISMQCWK